MGGLRSLPRCVQGAQDASPSPNTRALEPHVSPQFPEQPSLASREAHFRVRVRMCADEGFAGALRALGRGISGPTRGGTDPPRVLRGAEMSLLSSHVSLPKAAARRGACRPRRRFAARPSQGRPAASAGLAGRVQAWRLRGPRSGPRPPPRGHRRLTWPFTRDANARAHASRGIRRSGSPACVSTDPPRDSSGGSGANPHVWGPAYPGLGRGRSRWHRVRPAHSQHPMGHGETSPGHPAPLQTHQPGNFSHLPGKGRGGGAVLQGPTEAGGARRPPPGSSFTRGAVGD